MLARRQLRCSRVVCRGRGLGGSIRAGRGGVGVLLALVALGGLAPASAEAVIVYECQDNLCRVNSDGSGAAQLTTEGSATNDYHWPSISRDGTRMSWIRHGGLYLGDANARASVGPMTGLAQYQVLRPDGGQIATLSWGVFSGLWVYVYDAGGTLILNGVRPDDPSLGWTPANWLLVPWNNPNASTVGICAVSADTTSCDVRLASDPAWNLADPAVSPDGRTLAVSAKANASDAGGHIALYDYASHAFLRNLTAGTQDTNIAWSPDGTRLVFQRGFALYTVGANGAPGSEQQLVANAETPSWGGTDITTPVPTTPGQTPVQTNPGPGPGETVALTVAKVFRLPSNRRCLKRPARLRLVYLKPAGVRIDRLEVAIGRRRLLRRSGAKARRTITLNKLPAKKFTLTVKLTPAGAGAISTKKTYRVCQRARR